MKVPIYLKLHFALINNSKLPFPSMSSFSSQTLQNGSPSREGKGSKKKSVPEELLFMAPIIISNVYHRQTNGSLSNITPATNTGWATKIGKWPISRPMTATGKNELKNNFIRSRLTNGLITESKEQVIEDWKSALNKTELRDEKKEHLVYLKHYPNDKWISWLYPYISCNFPGSLAHTLKQRRVVFLYFWTGDISQKIGLSLNMCDKGHRCCTKKYNSRWLTRYTLSKRNRTGLAVLFYMHGNCLQVSLALLRLTTPTRRGINSQTNIS